MKEKMITLHSSTNRVGSECSCDLCTKEEWDEMSEDERDQLISELQVNIIDLWVEGDDQ